MQKIALCLWFDNQAETVTAIGRTAAQLSARPWRMWPIPASVCPGWPAPNPTGPFHMPHLVCLRQASADQRRISSFFPALLRQWRGFLRIKASLATHTNPGTASKRRDRP